ncbi:MAG: ribbon-helix-helix protein, CopG family [Chloroflexi bacterium]|nr:ribbon-helix-helix protein, CopG family [Chloroflexota bacterium]
MQDTAKITFSLPRDLLDSIERERAAGGETRSQFLRRAIEAFFRRQREREEIERYIRGYQQYPETAEEIAFAESALADVMAENPWDEGAEQ